MLFRKGEANLFITDESIGIYQLPINKKEQPKKVLIELENQIIENGYIVDPEILLLKLKLLFKQNNLKPRSINLTIQDQNLLIREFVIQKEELQKKSVLTYIHEQEGKRIHFPFDEANITFYTKSEDETTVTVVVIIADENLLHDYHDIFDRLGIKYVSFNIAPRVLYRLYEEETNKKIEQLIIVSLYNQMVTINVLENGIPVFGMIEESEDAVVNYFELVENYIERVANYYKFNIKKGSVHVSDIVIFNFNKQLTNADIKKKVKPQIENVNLDVYESSNITSNDDFTDVECIMAYASSIRKDNNQKHLFNFNLERTRKINLYGNLLLVIAFAVFSGIALIYIPYITSNEDINVQENINNILQNQLETLIEDTPIVPETSQIEKDYSDSYDFLIEQVDQPASYLGNLLDEINGSLEVQRYSVDAEENKIILLVSATSEVELYEYLIQIYEAYGVTSTVDDTRWMAMQPSRRFISSLLMEVTIYYA